MDIQKLITVWSTKVYSADRIVAEFGITHLTLRRALHNNNIPMPPGSHGLHVEVYNEWRNGNWQSVNEMMKEYHGTSTFYDYIKKKPGEIRNTVVESPSVTAEDILEYQKATGANITQVTQYFGISRYHAHKITAGQLEPGTPSRGDEYNDEVRKRVRDLLASGMKQALIAEELGVSQSFVSQNNPNKRSHTRGTGLGQKEWEQLKASLHRYSLRELARLYGVSKSYISLRLQNESEASGS